MKKIFLILFTAIIAVSCSDNLEELNENIKDPASVSGESLFTNAQKNLVDQMVTQNVNQNNNKLWSQYLQETTYTDESNYDQVTRSIPDNHWSVMYKDVLKDLKEASRVISETVYTTDELNGRIPNKLAIIELMTVYAYANLVETYGNIPYTQALDIETLLPKYDDGKEVYLDLISRATAAVNSLNAEKASFGDQEDRIYQGDIMKWKKFGNSLKLRMGNLLSDVDPAAAQSTITSAIAGGVFTSNDDNATYSYLSADPNTNPVYADLVLSGRSDYVAGNTIVKVMNNFDDPRRTSYFDGKVKYNYSTDPDGDNPFPVTSVSTNGNVTTISFENDLIHLPAIGDKIYLQLEDDTDGLLLGTASDVTSNSIEITNIMETVSAGDGIAILSYVGGQIGYAANFADHSHMGEAFYSAMNPGDILDYAEVEFIQAEAAARGFGVSGTPESHYVAAITASFSYWEVEGVAGYLSNPSVDYTTAISNSTATDPWKEVIGTQKWIAMYNRGFAGWTTLRLLDYPILVAPVDAQSGFPTRYLYPVEEQTLNGANYEAASTAIGGDATETRLFWDKFYTFDF